jgi:hypothetical protein
LLLFMAVVRRCFLLLLLLESDIEPDIAPDDDDMLPLALALPLAPFALFMLEFEFDCATAGVARLSAMAAISNCFKVIPPGSCDVSQRPRKDCEPLKQ